MSRPNLFRLDTYGDPVLSALSDLNGVLYLTVRANGTDKQRPRKQKGLTLNQRLNKQQLCRERRLSK